MWTTKILNHFEYSLHQLWIIFQKWFDIGHECLTDPYMIALLVVYNSWFHKFPMSAVSHLLIVWQIGMCIFWCIFSLSPIKVFMSFYRYLNCPSQEVRGGVDIEIALRGWCLQVFPNSCQIPGSHCCDNTLTLGNIRAGDTSLFKQLTICRFVRKCNNCQYTNVV